MHTEEQVNSIRCPLLELIQAMHSSTAPGGPVGPIGCIGSGCMYWRWEWNDHKTGEPDGGHATHGYCGLAGLN